MLELQMTVAAGKSIEGDQGRLKRKALGYVYGYIDAALRTKGHDMADMSIGVPITFQVIRRLWPDHVNECMDFLAKNLQSDALMASCTADNSSLTTQSLERLGHLWGLPAS
jgi:hypothetical protein